MLFFIIETFHYKVISLFVGEKGKFTALDPSGVLSAC